MSLISVIISSGNAIIQTDFKRLIAYTSIAHMNFVVLGLFSQNIFGIMGGTLLMLAHGLTSSGLFASVGIIYNRYFSRQLEYYSGLIIGMPLFATLFFFILIGNFGFPLTFNFVGELLILIGLAHFNFYILFLSSLGLFLSVAYSIILYDKVMFGNAKSFVVIIKDVNILEFNSLFSIAIFSIFFGIQPTPIIDVSYLLLSYYCSK
jgi:NADH:ubiquinone oxidoreductase subunit 4 (subunit M)